MRTLMAFLLGAWLLGMILVAFVAAENFFEVDRLLASPPSTEYRAEFQKRLAPLAPGDARMALRYLSSELNRFYFRVWGGTELMLGAALLVLAIKSRMDRRFRAGVWVMLALSVLMTVYLTPQLVEIGRALDFASRDTPPPQLGRFGMLHGAYSALDLLKLLVGIWLTVRLVRAPVQT
ncbi:MAG: hypothetical protein ACRD88_02065 [Terriglobia bacterium]